MRALGVLSVLLCASMAAACSASNGGSSDDDGAVDESPGDLQQSLWSPAGTQFWPNGLVKVCFDSDGDADSIPNTLLWNAFKLDYLRWVRTEISPFAKVDFVSNDSNLACPAGAGPEWLQIKLSADGGSHTPGEVGYKTGGNSIYFGKRTKAVALHETMHALGYKHEFKREETNPCSGESPITDGWTPYDLYSITNSTGYCHGLTELSAWDRAGLNLTYGSRSDTFTASFSGFQQTKTESTQWVNVASRLNPSTGGALTVNDILVGNFVKESDEDYAADDLLVAAGSGWYVSSKGYQSWQRVNTSTVAASSLLVGDFNGDGLSDILRPTSSGWYVSWSGTGNWTLLFSFLGTAAPKSQLLIGDFDGDNHDDVLITGGDSCTAASPCDWYLSSGGSGFPVPINSSSAPLSDLKVGDLDGDNKDDIFYGDGTRWRFSSGAAGTWQTLASSSVRGRDVLLGNFDGQGHDDVFTSSSGAFKVSPEGTSSWVTVATSSTSVANLRVANFGLGRGSDPDQYGRQLEDLPTTSRSSVLR